MVQWRTGALNTSCNNLPLIALLIIILLGICAPVFGAEVTRGPYLQNGSATSITLMWRTDVATQARVAYGTSLSSLNLQQDDATFSTNHEVRLTGLQPSTQYFYSIGSPAEILSGPDEKHFFVTSPPFGVARPTRVLVFGDSGSADNNARAVRNAYKMFTGPRRADIWLMLGDNAYEDGTDSEYQAGVFDIYPDLLKQTVLWPTFGNHDAHSADSATQSGPYYEIFQPPTNGEAGGVPSGTEAYYSFDYGNIHFINLDTSESDLSSSGPMLEWLEADLSSTTQDWVIAYGHHPPYSKGGHNSDSENLLIEMRENVVPILESYGVDLVLSGHSHSFERSMFIDGHYGPSDSLAPSMIFDSGNGRELGTGAYQKDALGPIPHQGAVFTVVGNSSRLTSGPLNHPVMIYSQEILGSMVIDIFGEKLNGILLDVAGNVVDSFTILKGPDITPPSITSVRMGQNQQELKVEFIEVVAAASASEQPNYQIDNSIDVTGASLAADGKTVVLTTSEMTPGDTYTLTVNNVTDLAGNAVVAAEYIFQIQGVLTAWSAADQNPGGVWLDSGRQNQSFRVLLDGASITRSGATVQLSLRGRSAGDYTVQRVSLVQREGNTLNGVDTSFSQVTFGGSWDAGVTVPAGGMVTSDPIRFDLVVGQDVFLTYWVPPGNPTVYRNGGSNATSWMIDGTDQAGTIDWDGLSLSDTRSHLYVGETLAVAATGPVGPSVTIDQASGQVDPTSAVPINFTAIFSAEVTGFATGDVTLGGTAGATSAEVTGSGTSYNIAVSGMTGAGTVTAAIAAGVATDGLGNPNSASTSTDNIVNFSSGPGGPDISWTAAAQNPGGGWLDSGWENRSIRVLLDGPSITTSGSTVQLTLKGRSTGDYRVQRVSLVQRDGDSLDGVNSSFRQVTFGGAWDTEVTVPAGESVRSDPISFDLLAGQDVFLTYWIPPGGPVVYRSGGTNSTSWGIIGTDQSRLVDWGGLSISATRSHIYVGEALAVVGGGVDPRLTISLAGSGSGTVTSDLGAINCPTISCTDTYTSGTEVILTAAANPGSDWTGWSGAGCQGTAPCRITMDQAENVSATFLLTAGEPILAWTAAGQNPGGGWLDSGWDNRSFRVLLEGSAIVNSGNTVQLRLRGRSSGDYRVERVSLVLREGDSLNGVDSSFRQVSFGNSWDAGVTVPAGGSVLSDPLPFDLVAGQDVFLSYWVPSGEATVYRNGGDDIAAWVVLGEDDSNSIDWGGLNISATRSHLYIAEALEVAAGQ